MQPKFFKGKYQDSLDLFNLPLQVATEREIARQQYSLAGQSLSDWTVRLKAFPHPALSTNNIVGQVIGPFLFAASMFSYVPVVSFPFALPCCAYSHIVVTTPATYHALQYMTVTLVSLPSAYKGQICACLIH